MVALAEVALDGRLVVPHQGDDDLPVPGLVPALDDDVVALQDPRVDHRVAAHLEDVLALVAARGLGYLHVLLDVLLGQDRRAGGDGADDRQAPGAHLVDGSLDRRTGAPGGTVEQFQRTRLGRVAPQDAELLEVRKVGVHRGGRGEPHRLADIANGRRVAVLLRIAADEVEDLLLALGQVHWVPRSKGWANMCSIM